MCRAASHSCRPVLAIAVSDLSSCFLSLCADVPPGGFFFFPFSSWSPLPAVYGAAFTLAGLSLPLQSVTQVLTFCLCMLTSLLGDFFFFPFSSRSPCACSFPQCPLLIVPIQSCVISYCRIVIKSCHVLWTKSTPSRNQVQTPMSPTRTAPKPSYSQVAI